MYLTLTLSSLDPRQLTYLTPGLSLIREIIPLGLYVSLERNIRIWLLFPLDRITKVSNWSPVRSNEGAHTLSWVSLNVFEVLFSKTKNFCTHKILTKNFLLTDSLQGKGWVKKRASVTLSTFSDNVWSRVIVEGRDRKLFYWLSFHHNSFVS